MIVEWGVWGVGGVAVSKKRRPREVERRVWVELLEL